MTRDNRTIETVIRPMKQKDLGLITNSWLRAYVESDSRIEVGETEFFAFHHDVVRALLARSKTLVACNPEDPDDIYGYLCADAELRPPVLHFVYVKAKRQDGSHLRRKGVARRLVTEWLGMESTNVRVYYSHRTDAGDAAAPHLFAVAEHNMYLQFMPWPPKLKP